MSLQSLTLSKLRDQLPASLLDELLVEIKQNLWICYVDDRDSIRSSCLLMDPQNATPEQLIQSIVNNEDFIRRILGQALINTEQWADEIFYIFSLKYPLTLKGIRDFFQDNDFDVFFVCQQTQTHREVMISFLDSDNFNFNHTYTLNAKEQELANRKLIPKSRIDEFISFVEGDLQPKNISWAELFVADETERRADRQLARAQENRSRYRVIEFEPPRIVEAPRARLRNVDWSRVNVGRTTATNRYYTVPELENLLTENNIFYPRGTKKADLIALLEQNR